MREQWNTAKDAVRLKAEARRAREQAEENRRAAEAVKEAKIRQALATRETLSERVLSASALPEDLVRVIEKKAPRLAESSTIRAMGLLKGLQWLRAPRDWKPKGKGRETLFRSLCEHLLAKYPMPAFLWSAFFEEDASSFTRFVAHVAKGGSVYDGVKEGLIPIPFTRKMCHELMDTPADVTFFRALRRTEVRSLGGDARFFSTWMQTQAGRRLHTKEAEAFWVTVIEWFAKNPMIDPNQVSPLVDFIIFRRNQDAGFSMKGRTPLALIKAMEEWHGNLAKEKAIHGTSFKPSGFKPFELEKGRRDSSGNYIHEVWKVDEVLSSKALAEEGRVLSHCVYSYAWSIEKGATSIWSMTNDGQRVLTIEVRNDTRRIVQARGKYNRQSTSQEFAILNQWAGSNNLEINLGRW